MVDYPVSRDSPSSLRFWLVTLAAVAAIALTASLGVWQLGRAAQKQALLDAVRAQTQRPPIDGGELGRDGDSAANRAGLIHRPVRLQGRWVAERTVFIENRQMDGKPGFIVVTPLLLDGGRTAIAVQRGWAPRDFMDRTRLPSVQTPAGLVSVEGRLVPPPSRLYEFEASSAGVIRHNLDLSAFAAETGLPLLSDLSVQQDGAPGEGLLRRWPPPAAGVEKHHGYAFQWFGLSGLIAILYVWFQVVRRFRRPPRS